MMNLKLMLSACGTCRRAAPVRLVAAAGMAFLFGSFAALESQANLIGSGGFEFSITPTAETPAQTYYQRFGTGFTPGPIASPAEVGWTVVNRVDVFDTSAADYPTTAPSIRPLAFEGENYLELNGLVDPASGSISQTFGTVAGQQYALKFYYIPSIQGRDPNPDLASVTVTGTGSLFSGSIIALDDIPAPNLWKPFDATFVADSASTTLTFASSQGGNFGVGLDAISVLAVPEPTTFALWSIGLVGMGLGTSRRRRK